jgi:hypothetical protein
MLAEITYLEKSDYFAILPQDDEQQRRALDPSATLTPHPE